VLNRIIADGDNTFDVVDAKSYFNRFDSSIDHTT